MKFVTFTVNGVMEVGLLDEARVISLRTAEYHYYQTNKLPQDLQTLIEQGDSALNIVRQIVSRLDDSCPSIPLSAVVLSAPIPRPRKNIFCVGKNYVEHALEFAQTKSLAAVPTVPVIFTKPPTCVIGPEATVKHHRPTVEQLDYEVELAVVIGKTAANVIKDEAYEYVFGYTIMNDVTARDLQRAHGQWLLGKGADTFAPLGPAIVHKSVVPNPHSLTIRSLINGQLRQHANTKDMVFDIPTLIATISAVITLEPGDIIATGTPAGVGAAMVPPQFLQPGDEMRLEIESIGVLINRIEQ